MPNLRRFLARFLLSDNQMTIIMKIILYVFNLYVYHFLLHKKVIFVVNHILNHRIYYNFCIEYIL